MNNYILEYDAFLRSFRQNRDAEHAFLLGAGASIESGIPSAYDCIWEWKRDIFVTKNPNLLKQYKNIKSETVKKSIQKWIDNQGIYPILNSDEEYSFYAEKALPIEKDRQKYFQQLSSGKEPSLGYHLLSLLAKREIVKSVWTTNFDNLVVNAAYKNNIDPIDITLDTQDRIYRATSKRELLCISLHGDYKYGPLKNISQELDTQSEKFIQVLKNHLQTRHLIVVGYSGRDKSLMNALEQAYLEPGSGRLYWCGYGDIINTQVKELIDFIRENKRDAFFISTDGFDKTMLNLTNTVFQDSEKYLNEINNIKNNFPKDENEFIPFSIPIGTIHHVVKSNLSPFRLPKEVFQFEINIKKSEESWDLCRKITVESDITAIFYNGMIYAFGTKDGIYQHFKDYLKSDVSRTPIDRRSVKRNTAFRALLLKTITKAFFKNTGLACNFNNKIWDNSQKLEVSLGNTNFEIYFAIKLALFFDSKYSYIAFTPSFYLPENIKTEKEIIKEISRRFYLKLYNRKPNKNFDSYINQWKNKLFGNEEHFEFEYPLNSGSDFKFGITKRSLFVAVNQQNNKYNKINLPKDFNKKQIIYNGIEYLDPQLTFYNPRNNKPIRDFHPMRGLVRNQPYDYFMNDSVFKSEINLGIICPYDYAGKFYSFLNLLNKEIAVKHNPDFLITYPGFFKTYGIPINIPVKDSASWLDCNITQADNIEHSAQKLAKTIVSKIEKLENNSVVVVFIPEIWDDFTSYTEGIESFDLHDYIKAFAVQKGISTQLIREKTLKSNLNNQITWWLSLAFYVKSLRTPWILTNMDEETAFIGLGYSLKQNKDRDKIVLGCSHIYTSEGQGLKYKLTKIIDFDLDRRNNPYLSEQEAYQLGINIRELFFKSVGELPKKVVIHKRTHFTREEIKGLSESLKYTGIDNVDLIEINHEDNARFIAINKYFKTDDFPVSRGLCFPVSENSAYLFTHGIAPSVRNPKYRYFKGGTSLPIPLKIKKHYGNSDIGTIATEILGLSKMNWNSFDLYSKLPATIQSSNEIAKIGWLLSHYEGRTYDYRNFM